MSSSAGRFVRAQTTWTLMFFVAAALLGSRERVRTFSFVLWGSSLLLCAVALWESRLGRLPWLGRIPSFLKVDPEMLERVARARAARHHRRVSGAGDADDAAGPRRGAGADRPSSSISG
ncbi:hypothetical protein AB5I41_17625 [Sphingomonas sp. MMS24-JH45]